MRLVDTRKQEQIIFTTREGLPASHPLHVLAVEADPMAHALTAQRSRIHTMQAKPKQPEDESSVS